MVSSDKIRLPMFSNRLELYSPTLIVVNDWDTFVPPDWDLKGGLIDLNSSVKLTLYKIEIELI